MKAVNIGGKAVGEGHPCYVVAEIGINHNGDLDIARQLIEIAAKAGCDAVKFQKRTVEVVYTPEQLAKPTVSPFGSTTGDLKRGLEFGEDAYRLIDKCCRDSGIAWYATCLDEASVDFIDRFEPPAYKIASASLTDDNLLRHTRAKGRPIILSTSTSTMEQIDQAVETLGPDDLVILHACSNYPAEYDELNLKVISAFQERYGVPVGYAGHETGIASSAAAVAMGACMIERYITIDRAMWGDNQAAALGPNGIGLLVRDIRLIETALGTSEKRAVNQ